MIPIINATIYKCDWCKRLFLTQNACKLHERQCPKNQNKEVKKVKEIMK